MIKGLKRFNKIQKTSFIALVFVLLASLGGSTFAWLTSDDSVVNHFTGKRYYVEVELVEPNWTSVGSTQAQAVQPGMDIFKDPRVVNISEDECYVRMKVEITDTKGNAVDDELYSKIFDALGTYNGTEIESGISGDFTEYNGWYYYTKGTDYCVTLNAYDATTPLFTDVVIPSLKSEYTGIFDSAFCINVVAEAVFSVNEGYTVEEAAKRFDGTAETADETDSAEEQAAEEEVTDEDAMAALYEETEKMTAEPTHIEAAGEFNSDLAVSDGALTAEAE